MATIKERKNKQGKSRYTVEIRLKGHPRETATFERLTDARLWAQQTEADIRRGRHFKTVESKKRTLSDLINRFLGSGVAHSRVDYKKVEMHLEWWQARLGRYLLSDITPIRITELKDTIRNEKTRRGEYRSNSTINRYLSSLSICFSFAVKELGWVDDNPVLKVRKLTEPRGRDRFLEPDEVRSLLAVAKDDPSPHIYPVLLLAFSTGMRSSEITRLRWKDINLRNMRITLSKTKNGTPRVIPLVPPADKMVLELSKVRRIDTDYVFPQKAGEKPFNPRKAWVRVVTKADIEDFRLHDARHTAGSQMAMLNINELGIGKVLGHKTATMVKRYSHVNETFTRTILNDLNRQMFGLDEPPIDSSVSQEMS
jgi:integrase